MYSSSIGALGCKLETNRVAYWPGPVDCDNICVKVSHKGRSVNLLKIDTSGGSYDISYDAWNYLAFGQSARDEPHQGGGITMDYEFVNADECKPLLQEGKLELTAANSINFVASCLQNGSSWVARNYKLVNLLDRTPSASTDTTRSVTLTWVSATSLPVHTNWVPTIVLQACR